jgi:hypothetical protein
MGLESGAESPVSEVMSQRKRIVRTSESGTDFGLQTLDSRLLLG